MSENVQNSADIDLSDLQGEDEENSDMLQLFEEDIAPVETTSIPVALVFECDAIYEHFIKPLRQSRGLSKLAVELLRAYYDSPEVMQIIDAYRTSNDSVLLARFELERLTTANRKEAIALDIMQQEAKMAMESCMENSAMQNTMDSCIGEESTYLEDSTEIKEMLSQMMSKIVGISQELTQIKNTGISSHTNSNTLGMSIMPNSDGVTDATDFDDLSISSELTAPIKKEVSPNVTSTISKLAKSFMKTEG